MLTFLLLGLSKDCWLGRLSPRLFSLRGHSLKDQLLHCIHFMRKKEIGANAAYKTKIFQETIHWLGLLLLLTFCFLKEYLNFKSVWEERKIWLFFDCSLSTFPLNIMWRLRGTPVIWPIKLREKKFLAQIFTLIYFLIKPVWKLPD